MRTADTTPAAPPEAMTPGAPGRVMKRGGGSVSRIALVSRKDPQMNTPETPTNDSATCATCGEWIIIPQEAPERGWVHRGTYPGPPHAATPREEASFISKAWRRSRHVPFTVGPQPTAAELDASMLEDLRQWRGRQDDAHIAEHGAKLTGEELDMLLRVAAERDDLKLEDRNREAKEAAERSKRLDDATRRLLGPDARTHPAAAAFDPYGPPLDFSGHVPGSVDDILTRHSERVSELAEAACTHAGHTVTEGGATVCGACGLLLAWVRS